MRAHTSQLNPIKTCRPKRLWRRESHQFQNLKVVCLLLKEVRLSLLRNGMFPHTLRKRPKSNITLCSKNQHQTLLRKSHNLWIKERANCCRLWPWLTSTLLC
jgi:hypothetical protein